MTEQELYNEYRKSDCKSFTDFLINKITELKKTYRKQRNKRIDELQKENAELKKKVENLQKYLDTRNCYRECAETWLKLTEAKELLKQILSYEQIPRDCLRERYRKLLEEAEQFIKDSEVEK